MWINPLVGLCEGVEERPGCPGLKRLKAWFTPLTDYIGQLGCGYNPCIRGSDHDVVCTSIIHLHFLVALNPLIQLDKPVSELTHRTGSQLVQIAHGPPGVFTTNAHLAVKT